MNGAQLLMARCGSSGLMNGPPAGEDAASTADQEVGATERQCGGEECWLKIRDSGHEVLRKNRLAHKREGMAFPGGNFHETTRGCISRKEQNFAFWIGSLELDCQLDAVHFGHEHIGNQDVWATRLRSLHHLFGVRESGRLKAGRIQNCGNNRCGSRLIVHYEDSLRGVFCHGGILLHPAGRTPERQQSRPGAAAFSRPLPGAPGLDF